jgi:hypothetical protein
MLRMRFHPELEARGCNVKTVLCEIFEKIREKMYCKEPRFFSTAVS